MEETVMMEEEMAMVAAETVMMEENNLTLWLSN
jgi:hypothetical protein